MAATSSGNAVPRGDPRPITDAKTQILASGGQSYGAFHVPEPVRDHAAAEYS